MSRDRVKRIAESLGWIKLPSGKWESPCGDESIDDVDVLLKIMEYNKKKNQQRERKSP